jgi:subtilisin family serine protease
MIMIYRIFFLFICFLVLLFPETTAQSFFWIGFKDKPASGYSLTRPSEFLSPRALERRARQQIPVTESDLPVYRPYIDSLVRMGAVPIHTSRWLNGVTVTLPHDTLVRTIGKLGFVKETELSKPVQPVKSAHSKFETDYPSSGIDSSRYGLSVHQVGQLNGQFLHSNGNKGKGMLIAVLDAGFYRVDQLPAFDSLRAGGRIAGIRDFVYPPSNVYSAHTHGMMVLSTMAGNVPGQLIGTAPEASYLLLRSEDAATEYRIEEDNWVAAAEYADSLGADIINSSLGYSTFNDSKMDHTYANMDGKTTRVSRGANMAVGKGILVFSSAGNEGNKSWRYLISPADGDSVIAVGAVDKSGIKAAFSSFGPAPDGAVKPNLAAMGVSTVLQNIDGKIAQGNGTSFASPVLAGMAACLWQANPKASAHTVRSALIRSGSQYQKPDSLLGYGIPNMLVAHSLLSRSSFATEKTFSDWLIFPNPFTESFTFFSSSATSEGTNAEIRDISGRLILSRFFPGAGPYRINEPDLPGGIYFLKLSAPNGSEVHKILKIK